MSEARYSVAELAERVAMTPRNVRLYQTRGLLDRPQIEGREAVYGPAHLERLQLIRRLQAEGFSLDLIQRLLTEEAAPQARHALELATRMHRDSAAQADARITSTELVARFGPDTDALRSAIAAGVLVPREDGVFDLPNPALLELSQRALEIGVPLEAAFAILAFASAQADQAADHFVDIVRQGMWRPFEAVERSDAEWQTILTSFDTARHLAAELYAALLDPAIRRATSRAIEDELQQGGDGAA